MKKSELVRLIEIVVEKKLSKIVKKQVRIEVQKSLNEIFISKGKEALLGTAPQHTEKTPSLNEIINGPIHKKKKRIKKTGDPIKDVLLETIGGLPQDVGYASQYPTTNENQINTLEAAGVTGTDEDRRMIGAIQTMQAANRTTDQLPDHLIKALTKDYSGLMESVNNRPAGLGGMPQGPPLRMGGEYMALEDMSPQELASQGMNQSMAVPQQEPQVPQYSPIAQPHPQPVPVAPQMAPPGLKPPIKSYTP